MSNSHEPIGTNGWRVIAMVISILLLIIGIGGLIVHGALGWWIFLCFSVLIWVLIFAVREKNREVGENRQHASRTAVTSDTNRSRSLYRGRRL